MKITLQGYFYMEFMRFLSMLLSTLGASLLENLLTSKGVKGLNSSNIPG